VGSYLAGEEDKKDGGVASSGTFWAQPVRGGGARGGHH